MGVAAAALGLGTLAWWQTRPLADPPRPSETAEVTAHEHAAPVADLADISALPMPRPAAPTPRQTRDEEAPGSAPALPPDTDLTPGERRDEVERLSQEAHEHVQAGRLADAKRLLGEALELSDSALLRMAMASLYLRERDPRSAVLQLDLVPQSRRDASWYALNGKIAYDSGQLDKARRALEAAVERGAGHDVAALLDKVLREIDATPSLRGRASEHFVLSVEGRADAALVRAVLDAAEAGFRRQNRDFRVALNSQIQIIVYARRSFFTVTRAPHWAGGLFDGKVRVPAGQLERITPEFEKVLNHELTHALVFETAGAHCPRWLNEGLAEYYEGTRFAEAWQRVEDQGVERLVRARDLRDPALFYVGSLGRVEFLLERYGKYRMMQLLEALKASPDVDSAMTRVLHLDRSRFESDWQSWLRRRTR